MAIIGLGTDIVDIRRMEAVITRSGEAFANRVLATQELDVFKTMKHPARYLAKRFAAKEAAAKALGTGISGGVCFTDFIVTNNDKGAPRLLLAGRAAELASQHGVNALHISISDEKDYAMATVILEAS